MSRRSLVTGLVFALILPLAGARGADPQDPRIAQNDTEQCDDLCRADLERARAATATYRDADAALLDGFAETRACESTPDGVTGVHSFNVARFDGTVDVEQPEFLLYTPEGLAHAELRLVGVEYAVPVLQDGLAYYGSEEPDPDRINAAPALFGRSFDGPMAGQTPLEPWHYSLHAWIWSANPSGTFAASNPAEACGMDDLDLRGPYGTLDGCLEVSGVVSADPAKVRDVADVPDRYRLVGEDRGSAQLLIASFACEAITLNGTSRPTRFAEITPLIESPYGYTGDLCCSRYLWMVATDNPDFAEFYRRGTGLGAPLVVYDPGLIYEFEPVADSVDPAYYVRVPSQGYEISAVATEPASQDLPASVHIFSDRSDGTFHITFRTDNLRIGPAHGDVRADPDSLLAEVLDGGSSPMVTFSIGWDHAAAVVEGNP